MMEQLRYEELDGYIKKVIKESIYKMTGKEMKFEVNWFIVISDERDLYVNWKVDGFDKNLFNVAVKVRYRFENNISKYYDIKPHLFTEHSIKEELLSKMKSANEVIYNSKSIEKRFNGIVKKKKVLEFNREV